MLNVLIMVHNKFSQMLLRSVFANTNLFKVVIIPWEANGGSKDSHIPLLQEVITQNGLLPEDFHYAIVETNYSAPASTDINEILLRYFVNNFSQGKIIGYSGTSESLIKALNFDPLIFVLPKDSSFVTEVAISNLISLTPDEIATRIIKIADLKAQGLRRNSCPFRVEGIPESQEDMDSSIFRLRSNSMPPPVTPLFNLQAQQHPVQPQPASTTHGDAPGYQYTTRNMTP